MFLYKIISFIPFLVTIIVLRYPLTQIEGQKFLERFAIFLLIFLIWYSIRKLFLKIYARPANTNAVNGILYIPLVVLAFLQMIFLQIIKTKIELLAFQLMITSILGLGLRDSSKEKGYYIASCSLDFFSTYIIILLSFQMADSSWSPALFLLAASFTSIHTACYIIRLAYSKEFKVIGLKHLIKNKVEKEEKSTLCSKISYLIMAFKNIPRASVSTVISLLFFAAPTIVIGMSIFEFLPSYYGAVAIIYPLLAWTTAELQEVYTGKQLDNAFLTKCSGVYIIFTVIISLLSSW